MLQCKDGGFSKSHNLHSKELALHTSVKTTNNYEYAFEGPVEAFRNYSESCATLKYATAGPFFPRFPAIDPSLLSLDKSSLEDTTQIHPRLQPNQSPVEDAERKDTEESSSLQHHDASSRPFQHLANHLHPALTKRSKPLPKSENGVEPGHQRSKSDMEHVSSVLSATDSRRSSLVSIESFTHPPGEVDITFEEQNIWDELIDESSFDPVPGGQAVYSPLPKDPELSPANRVCCVTPDNPRFIGQDNFICEQCGVGKVHYLAILSLGRVLASPQAVNQTDHFRNTPLHCAVATGEMNLIGIRYLIDNGADIYAVNTYNETFLHMILYVPLSVTKNYLALLELLGSLNFSFKQRDCHGRTFLHALLEQPLERVLGIDGEVLSRIIEISKLDLHSPYNRGYTINRHLFLDVGLRSTASMSDCPQAVSSIHINDWMNSTEQKHDNWQEVWLKRGDWELQRWLAALNLEDGLTWIDWNGDTILTAVLKLKYWEEHSEGIKLKNIINEIVSSSSGNLIHIRDRQGDTPLAIAARHGFRPVLSTLLEAGANPNTRNYCGTGIL
jgi:ankyrin repeat protein